MSAGTLDWARVRQVVQAALADVAWPPAEDALLGTFLGTPTRPASVLPLPQGEKEKFLPGASP